MANYFFTGGASDYNNGAWSPPVAPSTMRALAAVAPGTASSLTVTVAASMGIGVNYLYWIAPSGDPGNIGTLAGNVTVTFKVTTANTAFPAAASVYAVAVKSTSSTTLVTLGTINLQTTGTKTLGPVDVSSLGFNGPDNSFGIRLDLGNSNTMSSQSIVLEMGTATEVAATPYSHPAAALPPHPLHGGHRHISPTDVNVFGQSIQRASLWMKRRSGIVVPRLWTPADPVAA